MIPLATIAKYRVPLVIAAVILFAVGLFFLLDHSNERAVDQARDAGVQQERAAGHVEVINTMKEAQDAREAVRAGGSPLYDECVRSAADPANCQRFLPR